jgi:hypothetical protein
LHGPTETTTTFSHPHHQQELPNDLNWGGGGEFDRTLESIIKRRGLHRNADSPGSETDAKEKGATAKYRHPQTKKEAKREKKGVLSKQ